MSGEPFGAPLALTQRHNEWEVRMSLRTIRTVATLGLLLWSAACSSSSPAAPTAVTTTAVTLQSVAPAGGTAGISSTSAMTMTFSGAMGQGMEQFVDLHRGDASGPVQPMTCSWSADRVTLTCRPDMPMDPDSLYTLHMGGGMMDGSGMRLNMGKGLQMGGQTLTGTMMGGMHGGQPMSMMGSGWRGSDGDYGMMFSFRTAK